MSDCVYKAKLQKFQGLCVAISGWGFEASLPHGLRNSSVAPYVKQSSVVGILRLGSIVRFAPAERSAPPPTIADVCSISLAPVSTRLDSTFPRSHPAFIVPGQGRSPATSCSFDLDCLQPAQTYMPHGGAWPRIVKAEVFKPMGRIALFSGTLTTGSIAAEDGPRGCGPRARFWSVFHETTMSLYTISFALQ